jgi:RNA polymerase sigma-70 factor (ECF subfamily)
MQSTTFHEGPRAFPSTLWSQVLAAGDPSLPEQRERLNSLLRAYWKPVFAYVRAAWRKPAEDARDLTQAFFARVLEKNYLATLRPEAGSFRGYLKTALRHFLVDAERAADARGPGRPVLSLDLPLAQLEPVAPAPGEAPDAAYDRHWFGSLLEESLAELRRVLQEKKKAEYHDLLLATLAEGAKPTYHDLAARFGISESDVRNRLSYCRVVLRRIVEARIQTYCSSREEASQEWRNFLGT